MLDKGANNGEELWRVEQSVMGEGLEEEASDSSVNGTESQAQEDSTEPGRTSPILELANQLIVEVDSLAKEQARRVAETEAARIRVVAEVRAQAAAESGAIIARAEQEAQDIVQAAARNADKLESEARTLADTVAEEIESALTRINDLLPVLTNVNDLLAATDLSGDESDRKLDVTNGPATELAPASGAEERSTET